MNTNKLYHLLYFAALWHFVGIEIAGHVLEYIHHPVASIYMKDFANYWIAAKVFFEGDLATLFDQPLFMDNLRAVFGPDYPSHNWSYPPSFLFFCLPLYWMPYGLALPVFLLVTFAAFYKVAEVFVWEANPQLWEAGSPWKNSFFFWLMLAVIICNIRFTQNGFLTSALFLAGLAYWNRAPFMAGIFIGLLTIKLQLGVLIPLALLIDRNWTAFFSATVTALGLVILSALVFGHQAWFDYFEIAVPYQTRIMTELGVGDPYLSMMMSGFMGARTLGIEGTPAWIIHSMFAIPGFVLAIWCLTRSSTLLERSTALVLGTFLVSPYTFNYDAGVLCVIAAVCAVKYRSQLAMDVTVAGKSQTLTEIRFMLFTLIAILPVVGNQLALYIFPISPFVILAGLVSVSPLSERIAAKLSDDTQPAVA